MNGGVGPKLGVKSKKKKTDHKYESMKEGAIAEGGGGRVAVRKNKKTRVVVELPSPAQ